MLRKSPTSNVWGVFSKDANLSGSYLKVTKVLAFFSDLKVFIVNGSTILFSKHGKIKR